MYTVNLQEGGLRQYSPNLNLTPDTHVQSIFGIPYTEACAYGN